LQQRGNWPRRKKTEIFMDGNKHKEIVWGGKKKRKANGGFVLAYFGGGITTPGALYGWMG